MYTESERLLNRISFAWNTFSIFILRLISIAPQFNSYYANAHFSRALARMNLGQNQSAIDDLTEAIRINCRHAKAYNTRGIIRSELGYNQDAIADYTQSLNIDPNYTDAYFYRALARMTLGYNQDAIDDYTQLLNINPNYTDAYFYRAETRMTLGYNQDAIDDYTQLLNINPNYTDAYFYRAEARMNLGYKQDAIDDYTQLLNIDPNYTDAYFYRAEARMNLGYNQDAIDDYNQVLNINHYSDQARRNIIINICQFRNIDHLCHFTNINNLDSILTNGLRSRELLDNQNVEYNFNDRLRLDNFRNAVCLSISFPNYKMFYKYSRENQQQWIVLLLEPSILWELDCAFCRNNAAANDVINVPIHTRKNPNELEGMFHDYERRTRLELNIPECYPTNPQAEVLVFNDISVRFIKQIHFYDEPMHYNGGNNGIIFRRDRKYFSPRRDYEFWRRDYEFWI